MHEERAPGLCRRDALRGLAAIGVALVAVAPLEARAADAKLAKSAVQYVDDGKVPNKDCDDCIQFIPGAKADGVGTCRIVAGAINPHGHCIAFSPKPKT